MASERSDGKSVCYGERDLGFLAAMVGEAALEASGGERPAAEPGSSRLEADDALAIAGSRCSTGRSRHGRR